MAVVKSRWRDRSVLITGGSGFVGYWLASKLAEMGGRVCVLDIKPLPKFLVLDKDYRKKIDFVRGSVTDATLVKKILTAKKIKTVFHLAAEAIVVRSRKDPEHTLDTNVRGTWIVLDAARKIGIQEVVVASSDKAYGIHRKLPYRETFALQGIYPYDCSKSAADLIAQMFAHTYSMHIAIARCGNIYGGGDMNSSRLIPDALRSLTANSVFEIRSNGKFLRDYVYITDAVAAYISMAEGLARQTIPWGTFNFASTKPLTVMQVLNKLETTSGKKLKTKTLNRAHHEIPGQYLDATKAKRILKWRPRVDYTAGFKATVLWYRNFFAHGGKLAK